MPQTQGGGRSKGERVQNPIREGQVRVRPECSLAAGKKKTLNPSNCPRRAPILALFSYGFNMRTTERGKVATANVSKNPTGTLFCVVGKTAIEGRRKPNPVVPSLLDDLGSFDPYNATPSAELS